MPLTSLPLHVAIRGWEGVSCSVGHTLGNRLSSLHTASTPGTAGKPSTDRYLYKRQLKSLRKKIAKNSCYNLILRVKSTCAARSQTICKRLWSNMRVPLPKGARLVRVEPEIVYYRTSEGSNKNKLPPSQCALFQGPLL